MSKSPKMNVRKEPADPTARRAPPAAERRRLAQLGPAGAFLFVAKDPNGASIAAVFAPEDGDPGRAVARPSAAEIARWRAQDWIERLAARPGDRPDTRRYRLSAVGRRALDRWRAADGAISAAAAEAPHQAQHRRYGSVAIADPAGGAATRRRVNLAESPLSWLARRKAPDGRAWLTAEEIEAGERLRADFEAAQIGPRVAQNWARFLSVVDEGARCSGGAPGSAARDRVRRALEALGPGLDGVAFRVCCFLEGLERIERDEGWAARSAKVVLKIALCRLAAHYGLGLVNEREGRIAVWRADAQGRGAPAD